MSELRLPEYFPLTVKPCHEVAVPFFQCFETNAVMQNEDDKDAGRRGLAACEEELRKYKTCMDKHSHLSKHYMKE